MDNKINYRKGGMGGIALILSIHPLDTIKVRMQSEGGSMKKCIKSCIQKEGFRGFYKGMGFPLASISFINSVVFSTNELCKLFFGYKNENSLIEGTITGAISGFVVSFVASPVELVKCRLQIQTENRKDARYKGIIDCLVQNYKEKGIRGIYQGNTSTIYREVPAYAAQFGSYYYLKYLFSYFLKIEQKELPKPYLMIIGALTGFFCWIFSYPQDLIKTKIQVDIDGLKYKKNRYLLDGGFFDCSKEVWRQQGARGFWVGFLPQSGCAIIGNAFLFIVYETTKEMLNKY